MNKQEYFPGRFHVFNRDWLCGASCYRLFSDVWKNEIFELNAGYLFFKIIGSLILLIINHNDNNKQHLFLDAPFPQNKSWTVAKLSFPRQEFNLFPKWATDLPWNVYFPSSRNSLFYPNFLGSGISGFKLLMLTYTSLKHTIPLIIVLRCVYFHNS